MRDGRWEVRWILQARNVIDEVIDPNALNGSSAAAGNSTAVYRISRICGGDTGLYKAPCASFLPQRVMTSKEKLRCPCRD